MIPLESPVPEIGTPGSESGGRKRAYGYRTEARCESAGRATDPLPATRLPSTLRTGHADGHITSRGCSGGQRFFVVFAGAGLALGWVVAADERTGLSFRDACLSGSKTSSGVTTSQSSHCKWSRYGGSDASRLHATTARTVAEQHRAAGGGSKPEARRPTSVPDRFSKSQPKFTVRRERRHSSAGANPARQLSLQPVAVGADGGGNDIRLKHSDAKGPPRATQRPCRPQGLERCAGLETGNAEADPPVKRGRLLRAGKRATGAPARSAGVLAAACMEGGSGRNAGSPAGGVAHANRRPVRARSGRTGWRRSSYYRGGRVMPAEGRSFRWKGWRKGAGSREWLTPSTPEMSSNAGRRHMHKRRGRP